jgi:hypothetical protein
MFPDEAEVRQQAYDAGWLEAEFGNLWALVFETLDYESLTLRAHPSFYLEGARPAFLVTETLDGNPMHSPAGLHLWVRTGDGRPPTPEEAAALLGEHGDHNIEGATALLEA